MKFQEMLNRISGISVPIFGIQWQPSELEIEKARRILAFLEDRRVLFVPSEVEVPRYCVESVIKIREFLTNEIGTLDFNSNLANYLRAMRASCRKFLNDVEDHNRDIVRYGGQSGHWASWEFMHELGLMQGVFSIQITYIMLTYGLDVESELASILPMADKDEVENERRLDS